MFDKKSGEHVAALSDTAVSELLDRVYLLRFCRESFDVQNRVLLDWPSSRNIVGTDELLCDALV